MSERTFFSLRYALPGYTFILVIVLVAYPELQNIWLPPEHVTLVAAFLTFLSLLSGSALGFLVSQVWYVIFTHFIIANYGKIPDAINLLKTKYGLTDDKDHQIVFLDYIHRLSNKEMQIYAQRRFDLMHLCGSTLITTIVGYFFGIFIRIYLLSTRQSLSCVKLGITAYDLLVSLIVVCLIILLFLSLRHAQKEHAMAFEVSVKEVVENKAKFPLKKAKKVFPEDYFSNEN